MPRVEEEEEDDDAKDIEASSRQPMDREDVSRVVEDDEEVMGFHAVSRVLCLRVRERLTIIVPNY